MSEQTVMLSRTINERLYNEYVRGKVVAITRKMDGVAARFDRDAHNNVVCISRQGKQIHSVQHICEYIQNNHDVHTSLVGELYIPGQPFKDISGRVRRQVPDTEIQLCLYDVVHPHTNMSFAERISSLMCVYTQGTVPIAWCAGWYNICIPDTWDYRRFLWYLADLLTYKAIADVDEQPIEGLMIRPLDVKGYTPGKRSPNMLRWLNKPRIDCVVKDYMQAEDIHGVLKDELGSVFVEYIHPQTGNVIGCKVGISNMGRMYKQRLWKEYTQNGVPVGLCCTVEYKHDPTYTGLREGQVIQMGDWEVD